MGAADLRSRRRSRRRGRGTRRHPDVAVLRRWHVQHALEPRSTGAPSIHGRHAGVGGCERAFRLHQPGDSDRHVSRVRHGNAGRWGTGVLPQGIDRHLGSQSGLPLLRAGPLRRQHQPLLLSPLDRRQHGTEHAHGSRVQWDRPRVFRARRHVCALGHRRPRDDCEPPFRASTPQRGPEGRRPATVRDERDLRQILQLDRGSRWPASRDAGDRPTDVHRHQHLHGAGLRPARPRQAHDRILSEQPDEPRVRRADPHRLTRGERQRHRRRQAAIPTQHRRAVVPPGARVHELLELVHQRSGQRILQLRRPDRGLRDRRALLRLQGDLPERAEREKPARRHGVLSVPAELHVFEQPRRDRLDEPGGCER